ncbi:MAG TPA: hypothetical protein ENJ46_06620 [Hellea balneolensis]|uniref:Uncharacterized protein n=1 Tax=Hellea balneolensis TaxID=287478 RepID=A0A7C3C5Y8_9PROT|nr:hypothetical protein [Hellea balneolensis]
MRINCDIWLGPTQIAPYNSAPAHDNFNEEREAEQSWWKPGGFGGLDVIENDLRAYNESIHDIQRWKSLVLKT